MPYTIFARNPIDVNLDLSNRVAIVCGSTQGIGRSAALGLAKMGANVIAVARNENKLRGLVEELKAINDAGHSYVTADFSNPGGLNEALATGIKSEKIDILINNTGGPPGGLAIDAYPDDFRSAFEMHLICNQVLAKFSVPRMKKSGYGRIINIISTSVKQPLANLGVSNTIRGAVANWSKTLANELGQFNITVNNVLPGPTDTARLTAIAQKKADSSGKTPDEIITAMGNATPMNRIGTPEEVANAVCFLASPAASYINGINLPVDGGRTGSL